MADPLRIAIVGASGGIGRAMLVHLLGRQDVACVHATSLHGSVPALDDERIIAATVDVTDEASVRAWLDGIEHLDWLINCVGMLHDDQHGPEKSIRQVDADHFSRSMQVNTLPTLLLAKHAERLLKKSDSAVFSTISARVGSIEDNRLGGWISYRASKAALNMALKCIAIEWQRSAKHIRVLSLHPGTTDTPLSKPFQGNVPEGKLFSPEKTAALLISQLDGAGAHASGRFIDYAGEPIPW